MKSSIAQQRSDRLNKLMNLWRTDGYDGLLKMSLNDRRFLYLCTCCCHVPIANHQTPHCDRNNYKKKTPHCDRINNLISPQECNLIVQMAHRHAAQSGNGWTRNRHTSYPTTDIPLFCHGDGLGSRRQPNGKLGEFVLDLIQQRVISALLETSHSVEGDLCLQLPFIKGDLCLLDAFIVRYSMSGQTELPLHTDGSLITLNVSLNDKFTGGGTFFEHSGRTEQLAAGDALIHWSKLVHGGRPIDSGERLIMVAFIDTKDTSKLH